MEYFQQLIFPTIRAEILDLGGDNDNKSGWWSSSTKKVYITKIDHRKTLTVLYHQTSPDAAQNILKDGFKRGTSGLAGGGVYFASNPKDTNHKAKQKGAILECKVELGDTVIINSDGTNDHSKTLQTVLIPRSRGDEYVVYNIKRIKTCTLFRQLKNV